MSCKMNQKKSQLYCFSTSILSNRFNSSYDPSFEQWEFGKLSALREIALALEDSYHYYYMGE